MTLHDREAAGSTGLRDPGTAPEDGALHPVAPGIWAYIQPDGGWYINNSAVLVGSDAVIVVDAAATEERTRHLRAALDALTDRPVTTLLNTHWHTDHTNGNSQFRPATIVSHRVCRETLVANGVTRPGTTPLFPDVHWGHLELAAATLTFEDAVRVWTGDTAADFRFAGISAHTTSDSYLWVAEHRVLVAGDLVFAGCAPLVSAGSVAGAITVLEQLQALGPRVVIPGHGGVRGPEVLAETIAYLEFVGDVARRGFAHGRTPLDAALDTRHHPYAQLPDGERLVANLHRAYAEIDGAPAGAPIDLDATRHDMLAMNGGEPLRCNA